MRPLTGEIALLDPVYLWNDRMRHERTNSCSPCPEAGRPLQHECGGLAARQTLSPSMCAAVGRGHVLRVDRGEEEETGRARPVLDCMAGVTIAAKCLPPRSENDPAAPIIGLAIFSCRSREWRRLRARRRSRGPCRRRTSERVCCDPDSGKAPRE